MRRTAVLLALLAAGCGSDRPSEPRLQVAAARALEPAFTTYARGFPGAAVQFDVPRALARRVRREPRPDVVAAPSRALPALYSAGLVEKPRDFAQNDLVLVVPVRHARANGVDQLGRRRVRIALGRADSPVGMSTRMVLARLQPGERAAIERNVRAQAADSAALARLVAEHRADAAFVYMTEARRWRKSLLSIDLSDRLAPRVRFGIAVVRGAAHPRAARAFVAGLGKPAGRHALTAAGFLTAPFRPR
jgi:ABC-type molybdate transport system substrate-binding protein